MTYAKLEYGVLSLSTEEQEGYKPFVQSSAPSSYHVKSYEETQDSIAQVWVAPPLDALKAIKKAEAEAEQEAALVGTATLDVEGVGGVVWNTRAELNVSGAQQLIAAGKIDSQAFILADDSVMAMGAAELELMAMAMASHVAGIYAIKTAAFAAIAACETVEELLEV